MICPLFAVPNSVVMFALFHGQHRGKVLRLHHIVAEAEEQYYAMIEQRPMVV